MIAHFIPGAQQRHGFGVGVITGMLVFSGLGSLACDASSTAPAPSSRKSFWAIFLILSALCLHHRLRAGLDRHAALPAAHRVLPAAADAARLPDGLPDADRHDHLGRLGKDHVPMGVGINGCFSVIGAALGSRSHQLRPACRGAGRRHRLSDRTACLLLRAHAARGEAASGCVKRRALLVGLSSSDGRARKDDQASQQAGGQESGGAFRPPAPDLLKEAESHCMEFNASPFPYRSNIPHQQALPRCQGRQAARPHHLEGQGAGRTRPIAIAARSCSCPRLATILRR